MSADYDEAKREIRWPCSTARVSPREAIQGLGDPPNS